MRKLHLGHFSQRAPGGELNIKIWQQRSTRGGLREGLAHGSLRWPKMLQTAITRDNEKEKQSERGASTWRDLRGDFKIRSSLLKKKKNPPIFLLLANKSSIIANKPLGIFLERFSSFIATYPQIFCKTFKSYTLTPNFKTLLQSITYENYISFYIQIFLDQNYHFILTKFWVFTFHL